MSVGGVRHGGREKKEKYLLELNVTHKLPHRKLYRVETIPAPPCNYYCLSTKYQLHRSFTVYCMISPNSLTLLTIFNHLMIYCCSLGAIFCPLPKRQVHEKLSDHLELPLLKPVCSYVPYVHNLWLLQADLWFLDSPLFKAVSFSDKSKQVNRRTVENGWNWW